MRNVRAYIDLKTNIPDLHIDYVELTDKKGTVYNFNPNESSSFDMEGIHFSAEWRGVDIGEGDAAGQIAALPSDCKISAVGTYYELSVEDEFIKEMEFTLSDATGDVLVTKSFSIADVMPIIDRT